MNAPVEIEAMRACADALMHVPDAKARARVLRWLLDWEQHRSPPSTDLNQLQEILRTNVAISGD
jgi:hypothetical protein